MMKTINYFILLTFSTSALSLQALELRIGKGTFDWEMGVENFTSVNSSLDITTLTIAEQYQKIPKTKLYYFFDASLYASDTVDTITTLMSYPITNDFPVTGSLNDAIDAYTPIPTPSTYEMRGFDLNIGLGYELYKRDKFTFGAGLSTGLSMPVVKMKDLQKTIDFTYNLLESTKTSISTFKLGPALHAHYDIASRLQANLNMGLGYQTGSFENDWFRGSMDADGSYQTFDLAISYTPITSIADIVISAGYQIKHWELDDMKANMFDIFEMESYGMLNTSFSSQVAYVGVGVNF